MSAKSSRRTFLKLSSAAASTAAAQLAHAAPSSARVATITQTDSPIVTSEPVKWATEKLATALAAKGVSCGENSKASLAIVIATPASKLANGFSGVESITAPETIALIPGRSSGIPAILVTGVEARGIVYGLLELADRVRSGDDPRLALHLSEPVIETSPNRVRSVARAFLSEIEDKAWFYDRAFWTSYLDSLAAARFNRFNFALG